jgi:hypothetical protein
VEHRPLDHVLDIELALQGWLLSDQGGKDALLQQSNVVSVGVAAD